MQSESEVKDLSIIPKSEFALPLALLLPLEGRKNFIVLCADWSSKKQENEGNHACKSCLLLASSYPILLSFMLFQLAHTHKRKFSLPVSFHFSLPSLCTEGGT